MVAVRRAGSYADEREAWWEHYIAVKQELVESVLQDVPPRRGGPGDGGPTAAAAADWDAPCAAGWRRREARAGDSAAGAGRPGVPLATAPAFLRRLSCAAVATDVHHCHLVLPLPADHDTLARAAPQGGAGAWALRSSCRRRRDSASGGPCRRGLLAVSQPRRGSPLC